MQLYLFLLAITCVANPRKSFPRTVMLRSFSVLLLVLVAAADRCPSQCTCQNGGTTVDCSRRKLTVVPIGLPNTTVTLNLASNRISRLEANAFNGLTKLIKLDASSNYISTVNDMAFRGCCSELQTLILTANKISSIPAIVFDSLPSLRSLHLTENRFLLVPQVGQNGSASLVELYMANNRLRSATFPKSYASSTRLTRITLSNNANIAQLRAGDFSSLKGHTVRRLYLSRCQIKTVQNGSLSDLTDLSSIDMSHNPLGESGFRSLVTELAVARGLISLDASDVSLDTSLTLDKLAPLGATNLQVLDLSKNRIRSIENCTFCSLTGLKHLDLTSSGVLTLDLQCFNRLDSLTELRLCQNRLTVLPSLPLSLLKLDLSENDLEDLVANSFRGLTKLTWLNLRSNGLRRTEADSFVGLSSLKWLDISSNMMPNLSPGVFSPLTSLTYLNASNNNIRQQNTKEALFASQKKLVTLDLSNNKMDAISWHVLSGLISVKYLNLSRNFLGTCFRNSTCNEPVFVNAGSVEELDLSSNSIEVLPPLLFHNLSSLSTLRLSNNGFLSWDDLHLFDGDVNLASLFLDGNQISVLNYTSFASLPGLRSVSLKSNPLACSCDMIWFRRWINETSIVLLDLSSYACHSPPDATGKQFLQFDPDDLVCTEPPILVIAVTLAAGFVSTVIALAVVYRYRWWIRFRIYMARRRGLSRKQLAAGYEPVAGRELLYSAYISYCRSSKCKSEILEHLLPQIDGWAPVVDATASAISGGGLVVQIDEKFLPNRSVIESVVDAIDHSAICVVFLCPHYRSNRLCELELELAFTQSLFGSSGGDDEDSRRLPCIVVAYGDLGPRCIPRQLVPTFEKGEEWKWTDDDETSRQRVVGVLRDQLNDTGVFSKGVTCPDVAVASAMYRNCEVPA